MTNTTARETPTQRRRIEIAQCRDLSLLAALKTIYNIWFLIGSSRSAFRMIWRRLASDCHFGSSRVRRRVSRSGAIVHTWTFSKGRKLYIDFRELSCYSVVDCKCGAYAHSANGFEVGAQSWQRPMAREPRLTLQWYSDPNWQLRRSAWHSKHVSLHSLTRLALLSFTRETAALVYVVSTCATRHPRARQ